MLSRVAEKVYWTARYLDRIENTARLIDVYNKLMLDMPIGSNFNWYSLVTLSKGERIFRRHYKVKDEKNVVKFLLGDKANPSSIVSSLDSVRENIRTTRDTLPEFIWVLINEMTLFVENNLQQGIKRSGRIQFLDGIIHSCFQINGLLQSTMPTDDAWFFMLMGRKIERADMTTRLLDAGARAFSSLISRGPTINSHQIVWGNILLTLDAHQAYRQTTRSAINARTAINYLLEDPYLPSSIAHCIQSIHLGCARLPKSFKVLSIIKEIEKSLFLNMNYEQLDQPFLDYLNELQKSIARIHNAICNQWFPVVHRA